MQGAALSNGKLKSRTCTRVSRKSKDTVLPMSSVNPKEFGFAQVFHHTLLRGQVFHQGYMPHHLELASPRPPQ